MRKLLRLAPADRRLLLRTLLLMASVRAGLSFLPFPRLRRLLARGTRPREAKGKAASVERIAWSITVASRYIPRATCLTQALTAQIMMARNGHEGDLCIGVARDAAGAFNAHAWVTHQGKIVVGSEGYEEFTVLPIEKFKIQNYECKKL